MPHTTVIPSHVKRVNLKVSNSKLLGLFSMERGTGVKMLFKFFATALRFLSGSQNINIILFLF